MVEIIILITNGIISYDNDHNQAAKLRVPKYIS